MERFRKKFEDDPATFMLIDRATKGQTETILFNIDIEGFSNKDKTAVTSCICQNVLQPSGILR